MSQLKAQVNKILTAGSAKIVPVGFIAETLLPFIPVVERTGSFGKHGKGHLRIVSTIAGGRGKYPEVDFRTYDTQDYKIESHGLVGMVTEDDYRNVEDPFDAEKDERNGLITKLQLGREKALADVLADTSTITQNVTLSGAAQFSDYAESDPLDVASDARNAIREACGMPPDTMWMDWKVYNMLRFHPQLLTSLGYKEQRPGGLSDQELAKAFDVERILIAKSVYNSAKQGQSDSIAPVWGKHLWFGVAPQAAAKDQMSFGYRLGFKGKSPRQVYTQPLFNPPGATQMLVEDHWDDLITEVGAVYLVKNAVA